MRVIGSIEARMGSSRLPGKTMMPIWEGKSLLECVVTRFNQCKLVDAVVVATSISAKDDAIADWCKQNHVACCRGSEDDVLDRVVSAAIAHEADAIVQMGADSAYLDYELIDYLIQKYKTGIYDYVCNDLKLTYPIGIYGHIVNVKTLIDLNRRHDLTNKDREDVVRYILENTSKYKILNVEAEPEDNYPQLRLTVDYLEDIEQARQIYAYFKNIHFTTKQLLALYHNKPEFFAKTKMLLQDSAPWLLKG